MTEKYIDALRRNDASALPSGCRLRLPYEVTPLEFLQKASSWLGHRKLLSRARFAAVLFLGITASIQAAEDESGIQAVWKQFLASWNGHDARAFSLIFSADADLTSWNGQHVRGRSAIEERFQPRFSGPMYKDSVCSGKVRMIRFLRPDIAIVDIDWEMTGARSADGSPRPQRKGLLDWVCEKQGQHWRIVAIHDVDFTAASIIVK